MTQQILRNRCAAMPIVTSPHILSIMQHHMFVPALTACYISSTASFSYDSRISPSSRLSRVVTLPDGIRHDAASYRYSDKPCADHRTRLHEIARKLVAGKVACPDAYRLPLVVDVGMRRHETLRRRYVSDRCLVIVAIIVRLTVGHGVDAVQVLEHDDIETSKRAGIELEANLDVAFAAFGREDDAVLDGVAICVDKCVACVLVHQDAVDDELATGYDALVVDGVSDDDRTICIGEVVVRAVSSRSRTDLGTELDALPRILDVGMRGDVDVVPIEILEHELA